MRNENQIIWKTKDGKVIPIKELKTDHLCRIILMLEDRELMREELEGMMLIAGHIE